MHIPRINVRRKEILLQSICRYTVFSISIWNNLNLVMHMRYWSRWAYRKDINWTNNFMLSIGPVLKFRHDSVMLILKHNIKTNRYMLKWNYHQRTLQAYSGILNLSWSFSVCTLFSTSNTQDVPLSLQVSFFQSISWLIKHVWASFFRTT